MLASTHTTWDKQQDKEIASTSPLGLGSCKRLCMAVHKLFFLGCFETVRRRQLVIQQRHRGL
jgi:hypothetical protein